MGPSCRSALSGFQDIMTQQTAEFGIAVILKALREVVGRNIRPTKVGFMHGARLQSPGIRALLRLSGRVPGVIRLPRVLGSDAGICRSSLDDPNLLETLKPVCDAASRGARHSKGTLRALVENEMQKALPHGDIRKSSIAKALGISPRTLSRRLADEGVTYAEVVDDLRRTLAMQYLKDPSISLSQIAWLLGYEGSTSFNHAFRRWTGRSPSALRQELSPT